MKRTVKMSQSRQGKSPRSKFKPLPQNEVVIERLMSARSRMIMWADGRAYKAPHYWIIVSRDAIGLEPKTNDSKVFRPPLLVVPINSYVAGVTEIGPSDVIVEEGLFLEGHANVIRCGYLGYYPRMNKPVTFYEGAGVPDKIMNKVDEKLVEVLELTDYIERLVKERMDSRR